MNKSIYSEIYLVDDEGVVNFIHNILLKKIGFENKSITFTNPKEALEHMRLRTVNLEPVLVLLDINMPNMSGFDLLELMKIERFPNTIDVVVLTSSLFEQDKFRTQEFPQFVIDYVIKPIKEQKLKDIIYRPLSING